MAAGLQHDEAMADKSNLEMMGPGSSIGDKPANPYCGRTAEITYNGKTVTGTLADKCMACVSH